MAIRQISVFVENKQGSLVKITDVLAKENIDLRAMSIADTQDFGILRLIVSDTDRALQVLKNENCIATVTEVVGVVSEADSRIAYFDAGSPTTSLITWDKCDIEYFNIISFARMVDPGVVANNIRIAPSCLLN